VILPNEKLIYIHVPKTGGASVEDFLLDKFGYERSILTFTDGIGTSQFNSDNSGKRTLYPLMHYTLPQLTKEVNRSGHKVDNSWNIFSIVRNPYYKLISELFFVWNIPLTFHYHTLPESARPALVDSSLDEYINNPDNVNYHSNHSLPQYKFFENTDLNYKIFKFEDGLENIMSKLGFEIEKPFPHRLNIFKERNTPKPDYKDVLTPYLVETVNNLYYKDFEIFGYDMLSPLDI